MLRLCILCSGDKKTLARLTQLIQTGMPFQTRINTWHKPLIFLTCFTIVLFFGGLQLTVSYPLPMPGTKYSSQSDSRAVNLIKEYEKLSLVVYKGAYIVTKVRQQNFFTEKEIAEQKPNVQLYHDRIMTVTEWLEAPMYRRESSGYSLHNNKESLPELIKTGKAGDFTWEKKIDIWNQKEHLSRIQFEPDKENLLGGIEPIKIENKFDVSPELDKEIVQLKQIRRSNSSYLDCFSTGWEISDVVQKINKGELTATYSIKDGTQVVSIISRQNVSIQDWYFSETSSPYPCRIEVKNGPFMGEIILISYSKDKMPSAYSKTSYEIDPLKSYSLNIRTSNRTDKVFETVLTGITHDSRIFTIEEKPPKEQPNEFTLEEQNNYIAKGKESRVEITFPDNCELTEEQKYKLKGYLSNDRILDYDYPPDSLPSNDQEWSLYKERPYKIELSNENGKYTGKYHGYVYSKRIKFNSSKKIDSAPEYTIKTFTVPFLLPNPNASLVWRWERSDQGDPKPITAQEFDAIIPKFDPAGMTLKGNFVINPKEDLYTWGAICNRKKIKGAFKDDVKFLNIGNKDTKFELIEKTPDLEIQLPPNGVIPAMSWNAISFSIKDPMKDKYEARFKVYDEFIKTFIATITIKDN